MTYPPDLLAAASASVSKRTERLVICLSGEDRRRLDRAVDSLRAHGLEIRAATLAAVLVSHGLDAAEVE